MGVLGLLKFLDFELLKNTVVIFVLCVSFVCPSFVRCVSAVCPSFVPSVSLVSLVSFVSFVSFVCPLYVLRVSAGMSSGVRRCPQVSAGVRRCPQCPQCPQCVRRYVLRCPQYVRWYVRSFFHDLRPSAAMSFTNNGSAGAPGLGVVGLVKDK